MGGEKPKSDRNEPRQDYEATMNDFLDKEITASAPDDQNASSDELDALVSNLLKEVITEADGQGPSAEAGVKVPAAPAPAVSASTQHRPGPGSVQREKSRTGDAGRVPSVVFAQSRPAPGKRGLLIAAALVCLLASIGFGIYHLTARRDTAAGQPPAPVSAVKGGPETAIPVSKPDTQPAAVRPAASPAQNAGLPAAVPSGKATPSAASAKPAVSAQAPISRDTGKDTKTTSTVPSTTREVKADVQAALNKPAGEPLREASAPPAANVATPPAAPEEKPSQPAVTVIESPAAAPRQPEKVENAPAAPPKEEPKPEPPAPAATNRADSPAPSSPAPPKPLVPSVVSPAVAISKVTPNYPEAARRMRIKGTVVLDLNIDANGKVTHVNIVSGDSVLAAAATDAVMRWRYKPALVNGKAVVSVARVSIVFNN